MLIGADFLYRLTLESTIKEWPLPECQVPLDRVPRYMHLVKIGLLTENEVCERLYGCIIANAKTRSTEAIDAVYIKALREGVFTIKHESPEETQHPERKRKKGKVSWLKRRREKAQPKTDPPNEYRK